MKATQKLHDLGQSIWLDNITRDLLNQGTLKRYIDELSVTGLTSNPTIFDGAIKNSNAYDAAIHQGLSKGKTGEELFFDLAIEDLTRAADLFRPVFDRTNGVAGWVSLEVSPRLAYDTASTLYGMLSESPLAVNAYFRLSGLIQSKSSLTPPEQQAVILAVNFENGCDYCMAAHSAVAAMVHTPPDVIQALRDGALPSDPKLAALIAFACAVVQQRGWVKEETLNAFLDAGFNRAQVLEVIVITALKTISNYSNHLAGTPLDAAFAGQKRTRPN
jgi:AhpD family alkylhydroperoxidase